MFCVNLAHLRELTNTYREVGIDARYVYAGTSAKERKALIDAFRAGEFPVLLNVGESYLLLLHQLELSLTCSIRHPD